MPGYQRYLRWDRRRLLGVALLLVAVLLVGAVLVVALTALEAGAPGATAPQTPGGPDPASTSGAGPTPAPSAGRWSSSPPAASSPGGPPSRSAGPGGTGGPTTPGPAGPGGPPRTETGWTVTVYYTVVERFHPGVERTVTGCPVLDCTRGTDDLGSYPVDFIRAVREEGTGRTTAGRYLNWSYDIGYWLDTAPRDAAGRALRPWVSAAADPQVLPSGARFRITGCGTDSGDQVSPAVCGRLRAARWLITDEFTPGLGGDRHLDAYIGEETGPDFTESPWYITLERATLRIN